MLRHRPKNHLRYSAYDGTIVYLMSGYDAQKERYELPFAQGKITAQQLAVGLDLPAAQ